MTKAAPNLRALDSTGRTSLGAGEKAELALTLRETARGTEWVFTSRPENAPPLAEMSAPLQALAQTAAFADPDRYWWWITDAALAEMAARLRATGLCIVDGILGGAACGELRREVLAAHAGGHLRPSKLAGGRTGKNLSYSLDAVRGDVVGWFDGDEDGLCAARCRRARRSVKPAHCVIQSTRNVAAYAHSGHASRRRVGCGSATTDGLYACRETSAGTGSASSARSCGRRTRSPRPPRKWFADMRGKPHCRMCMCEGKLGPASSAPWPGSIACDSKLVCA